MTDTTFIAPVRIVDGIARPVVLGIRSTDAEAVSEWTQDRAHRAVGMVAWINEYDRPVWEARTFADVDRAEAWVGAHKLAGGVAMTAVMPPMRVTVNLPEDLRLARLRASRVGDPALDCGQPDATTTCYPICDRHLL